jgi:FxsC-like protein
MAYEFFFSYSRDDWNPYMQVFFDRLWEEVRVKLGLRQNDSVGFRDTKEMPLGGEWPSDLLNGLQTSKVLVCVYTPLYFKREYCGREVQFFLDRKRLLGAATPQHPFIIPVVWEPCEESIPSSVSKITYLHGDFPPEYKTKGIRPFLQNSTQFGSQYENSIAVIGASIKAAVQQATQLPPLAPIPALENIADAFASAGVVNNVDVRPQGGPSAVQFYYVAGKQNELAPPKQERGYYDVRGGEFWRPARSGRFLGVLATAIASSKELDLIPYNMPLLNDFGIRLKAARAQNNMVVLFVDAWTLDLVPFYRDRMEEYESHRSDHCCVMVVWNEADPDVNELMQQRLKGRVRLTFPVNSTREPTYFQPSIGSVAELEASLRDTLERLRHRIIETAQVARELEGTPKPVLDIHIGQTR